MNNLFADYIGWQTGNLFVMPPSDSDWTNTTPWKVEVSPIGMDQGLGIGDSLTTFDMSPLTSGSWILNPGDTCYVAYSDPATSGARMGFRVFA